jgi:hypothetical protein
MKNKDNVFLKIIIGGLFSVVIIILAAFHVSDMKLAMMVLIIMVAVFTISGFISERRPKPDERTRRLDYRATSWSYNLTFMFVVVYVLHYYYFRVVTLSSIQLAGLLLYFMIFSNLIIKFIFRKRSDVSE